jgi:hypothetical protein
MKVIKIKLCNLKRFSGCPYRSNRQRHVCRKMAPIQAYKRLGLLVLTFCIAFYRARLNRLEQIKTNFNYDKQWIVTVYLQNKSNHEKAIINQQAYVICLV